MRPRAVRTRGYTVVELMMAITVFAIGVTGIAAMQKITLASNLHAKQLAIATHIAQSWQEQLQADSTLWLSTAPTPSATNWLVGVDTGWMRAPTNAEETFGASFGPLGDFTTEVDQSFFCVRIRMSSMNAGAAIDGNGLIRSEVMVYWPREGRDPSTDTHYCAEGSSVGIDEDSDQNFHFVHKVAAMRQST